MEASLLSLGLDVGTTTTQLVLSRLQVVNGAGPFSVPQLQIRRRQVIYRSPVIFTPLLGADRVDGQAIATWVAQQYREAGITKEQVDTGAVIITGETSRKENAAAVLQALSGFAGDFVAATAGPHLESVLAAKGAGAFERSGQTEKPVLHMDIGGGTTNLALLHRGQLVRTGCLNIGGRLLRGDYVSPVLSFLDTHDPKAVAEKLSQALEMAAGLRPETALLSALQTREAGAPWIPPTEPCIPSFSGGVADCIGRDYAPDAFGDLGPTLGKAIRESLLCRGEYFLGSETIRATVIGAGSHSAQLSGSTVFHSGVILPMKNLPVAVFTPEEQERPDLPALLQSRLGQQEEGPCALAFPGYTDGSYQKIAGLAERLAAAQLPAYLLCFEGDMAKALGQRLALLRPGVPCLCIDRVQLTRGSYLDVGKPLGAAFPLVVKTLILEKGANA